MKLLFEIRFSYLGKSGWKSDASKDAGLLFAKERMDYRFDLFKKITLPSIADQTDDDFDVLILISDIMPQDQKDELLSLCHAFIGPERTKILEHGAFKAGRLFRNYVRNNYASHPYVAQVVLDDDDAVSADFVEICKTEAAKLAATDYDADDGRFLSFMRGYSLLVQDGALKNLSPKNSPFVNLGLTLVAPPNTSKNPFLVSHLAIADRHPGNIVNTLRPFYLRTVHDFNDSRTPHKKQWLSEEQIAEIEHYFPFLIDHFGEIPNIDHGVMEVERPWR
ncbi:MAG: glycosyltransferase [Pseudomonadota bacterium]